MKKALKAAIGLLVVSLTFSSCELIALMMFAGELEDAFSAGVGSVSYPSTLYSGDNSSYVGYGTNGRNSYYKFTVPAGSDAVTITYSSTSSADLDFYLYSASSFTSLVEDNASFGTPTLLFDNQALTGGSTYYLRVYNYTNTATVNFSLNLVFHADEIDYTLLTMSSLDYQYRSDWTIGYLPAGSIHWYALDVNYANSEVYIHWQDSYDYASGYTENPSADIKVSVYAADKTTVIVSGEDNGYSSDYTSTGLGNGIGVTAATRYWVKVTGYTTASTGYYYLSAVEVPVN